MRRLRPHLTYANVMVTLLAIGALTGGVAYAADTIGSPDVIDNSLLSADLKNNQAVKTADVQSESLTGADIANQSGVDTCTHGTTRYGELCATALNSNNNWQGARDACALQQLRVPSLGEGTALAKNHSVANLAAGEIFWTEEFYWDGSVFRGWTVNGSGSTGNLDFMNSAETVCVTTPTN